MINTSTSINVDSWIWFSQQGKATLFILQGFCPPVNFDDPNNMVALLLASNLKKEEDVGCGQSAEPSRQAGVCQAAGDGN